VQISAKIDPLAFKIMKADRAMERESYGEYISRLIFTLSNSDEAQNLLVNAGMKDPKAGAIVRSAFARQAAVLNATPEMNKAKTADKSPQI
jgi:hypothetical protein